MMYGAKIPRVIGLIGCPGAGKSTFAEQFDPNEWVVITLDDFRAALWPPHRRTYWTVREGKRSYEAQQLLHKAQLSALKAALKLGWNVILADTHLRPKTFRRDVQIAAGFGVKIEWKLLDTPWEVLEARNSTRPADHRVPVELLRETFDVLHAPDAWWRRLSPNRLEIIPYVARKEAA